MKTIAVVSPVGGAGRTTLTAALAGLLAGRRHAVLAVECNPCNVLSFYSGLRESVASGLSSRLVGATDAWGEVALETDDGVLWLPWGNGKGDLSQVPASWLRDLLAQVDLPSSGVALVDTPTWPSSHASQAIDAADLVLVVLPPTPLACASLPRLRAALRASGKATVYVANAVSPASRLHTDIVTMLRDALGLAFSAYRIHADAGVPEALARGMNFVASAPHSQAAHDLQGLATWLSTWVHAEATTAAHGGVA